MPLAAKSLSHSSVAVRRAWGDYVAIFTAQLVVAVLTVGSVMLSARLLGAKGYGAVALFIGIVQCLFIVGVKWSFSAVIKFGREAFIHEGHGGRVFWAWLFLVGGSLLVSAAGLLLLAHQIQQFVGMPGSPPGLFLALLVLTTWAMAMVSLLHMEGKMRVAAWIPVAGRLGFVALLVAWAIWNGAKVAPIHVILFSIVGLAIQALLGVASLNRAVFWPVLLDWAMVRRVARYSFPLIFSSVGAYVSDWIDLYFLRTFRGYAEVGIYQVAYQALTLVTVASVGLSTLALPVLTAWRAEGGHDRVVRYAANLIPQITVLWCLCLLVLALIQEPLFPLILGSEFTHSGLLCSLLLSGAGFHLVAYLYLALFFAYDMPGRSAIVVLLMALVNVLGDWLLVPRFGAAGAALSTSLSMAVAAWVYLCWGNRRLGIDRRLALVPPAVVAVSLLGVAGQGVGMKAGVLFGSACVLICWARLLRVFSQNDAAIFDQVQMPQPCLRLLKRLYLLLSGNH